MEEATGDCNGAFHFERDIDSYIPVEVTETRLTGESFLAKPSEVSEQHPSCLMHPLLNCRSSLRAESHAVLDTCCCQA